MMPDFRIESIIFVLKLSVVMFHAGFISTKRLTHVYHRVMDLDSNAS